MISVSEAKNLIYQNIIGLDFVYTELKDALGLILAKDIISNLDIPPFDQSAMDGYTFSFDYWQQHQKLQISGVIPAGSVSETVFSPENSIRVFTGAAVPEGADTVIMQEKTTITNGQLEIQDQQIKKGNAIRYKGSEIKAGTVALNAGTYLSPAALGFLASIGIAELPVFPRPKISIIVTGDELQKPGTILSTGKIFESNSIALYASLRQLGIIEIEIAFAKDHLQEIQKALENALNNSDLVLLTGGVSVGDYDFVVSAATECGVTQLFHGVKQKPGKPLFFGMKNNKIVFGLPGNPSSVLTCFYEYVLPALHRLSYSIHDLEITQVPIQSPISKNTGLAQFLKAFCDGDTVSVFDAQESYKLSSFAKANCLIYVPAETTHYNEGDLVEIHRLIY